MSQQNKEHFDTNCIKVLDSKNITIHNMSKALGSYV